jgi:hypothetical protein
MPRTLRSTCIAIALALVLAGAAQARPLRETPAPAGPAALLDLVQGWLTSLWPPTGLSPIWAEEGGIMDPNGRPATAPQGPGQDAGGIMDPNG